MLAVLRSASGNSRGGSCALRSYAGSVRGRADADLERGGAAEEADLLGPAHVLLHCHNALQRGVVRLLQRGVDRVDHRVEALSAAAGRVVLQQRAQRVRHSARIERRDADGLRIAAVGDRREGQVGSRICPARIDLNRCRGRRRRRVAIGESLAGHPVAQIRVIPRRCRRAEAERGVGIPRVDLDRGAKAGRHRGDLDVAFPLAGLADSRAGAEDAGADDGRRLIRAVRQGHGLCTPFTDTLKVSFEPLIVTPADEAAPVPVPDVMPRVASAVLPLPVVSTKTVELVPVVFDASCTCPLPSTKAVAPVSWGAPRRSQPARPCGRRRGST